MAGAAVIFKFDDRELQKTLQGLMQRMGTLKPAMKIIGETVRASVVKSFEQGGRPEKWPPSKRVLTHGGKTLLQQGMAGGLAGSINFKAEQKKATIGTGKIYGAIHQFGGKAGRGRKVTIPARPYLMVQDEDWTEIKAALAEYVMRGRT